jgi:hypothetical protein
VTWGPLVAVTSVLRNVEQATFSGIFRVVDLGRERIVFESAIPETVHRMHDPNPRGGLRGARGTSVHGDRLVVANADRLFVFDSRWELVSEITHPWMGAIHDVLAEADGIWVTCTSADLVFKVGWDGELLDHWTWRTDRTIGRELGFRSVPPFEPDLDYRDPRGVHAGVHNTLHLNAVARVREGLVLLFGRILTPKTLRRQRARFAVRRIATKLPLGRQVAAARAERAMQHLARAELSVSQLQGGSFAFALVRPGPDASFAQGGKAEVLFKGEDDIRVPNHNVHLDGPLLLYNDTNGGRLVAYDRSEEVNRQAIEIPGSPSFARGLAPLNGRVFVVGSQAPAATYTLDLESGRVMGSVRLGARRNESVYSISVLPESFREPPEGIFPS